MTGVAFVAGLDRPIGHAVSRLLAQTVVGSKLAPTEDLEEDSIPKPTITATAASAAAAAAASAVAAAAASSAAAAADKGATATSSSQAKDTYRVVGTLAPVPVAATAESRATSADPPSTLSRNAMELAAIGHVQLPGDFVETGVRKRDAAKREAIERFSVLGKKAAWVSDIVAVRC
jgi:adenylate kinase